MMRVRGLVGRWREMLGGRGRLLGEGVAERKGGKSRERGNIGFWHFITPHCIQDIFRSLY